MTAAPMKIPAPPSSDEAADQIDLSKDQRCSKKEKKPRWTDEEHKLFLRGLEKLGKGKWKEISKQFVKSKNNEDVRNHYKYYLKKQAQEESARPRKRWRSTIYDNIALDPINLSTKDELESAAEIDPPSPPGKKCRSSKYDEIALDAADAAPAAAESSSNNMMHSTNDNSHHLVCIFVAII